MADLKIKKRILSVCQTNCYYVYREGADEIVVIDPGDMGDVVYEDVRSLGFTKVAGILLTHGHGDHTGGACRMDMRLPRLFRMKPWIYREPHTDR